MNMINYTMKILGILIFYSFTNLILTKPTQQWASRYNGPAGSTDISESIKVDGSGNVYITGSSVGSGSGYDYATVKYNSSGIQQWAARYNGPGNGSDRAFSLVIDGSGNVYVTGVSLGSGSDNDFATVKYNSSGIQQWVRRYNGPGNDHDAASEIAIDASGNIYVTGTSYGGGVTFQDYATVKYNSSGVQQWASRYDDSNDNDESYSITVDALGNVYVTGASGGTTSSDCTTIKYNSAGAQQWVRSYNGPGGSIDIGRSVAVDASGNIYVTGQSIGSGTSSDYATIKYNSSGVQQWAARYNGPGNLSDAAFKIIVSGSAVYVTGGSQGTSTGDFATIKYNSSGVQQWVARYNGTSGGLDQATDLALDASGNIYVTGYSYSTASTIDFATIKYNSSGVQQWIMRYNGPGNSVDQANAITVDASGNIYVTGLSPGSGTNNDYATVKYHEPPLPVEMAYFNSAVNVNNAVLKWGTVWELNNSGFDIERAGVNQGVVAEWKQIGFITGNGTTSEEKHYTFEDKKLSRGSYQYRLKQIDYNGNYEYHSLNSDVTIGAPKVFEVSQNYPNPSNPKSKIDFKLPFDGNISIKVYDLLGKEVAVLIEGFKPADFYSVEFDGSNLASGIYFYRITAGEFNAVKKMILVK